MEVLQLAADCWSLIIGYGTSGGPLSLLSRLQISIDDKANCLSLAHMYMAFVIVLA